MKSAPATRERQAKTFGNIFSDNIRLIIGFDRYYREIRSGYLIQERGIRRGRPGPEKAEHPPLPLLPTAIPGGGKSVPATREVKQKLSSTYLATISD